MHPWPLRRRFAAVCLVPLTLLLAGGCGDDTASDIGGDADADVGFVPCGGEQCASDAYCQRPLGFCSSAGNCEARPTTCSDDPEVVCGCNGLSYANRCVASKHNVSVESGGLCNPDDDVVED